MVIIKQAAYSTAGLDWIRARQIRKDLDLVSRRGRRACQWWLLPRRCWPTKKCWRRCATKRAAATSWATAAGCADLFPRTEPTRSGTFAGRRNPTGSYPNPTVCWKQNHTITRQHNQSKQAVVTANTNLIMLSNYLTPINQLQKEDYIRCKN